MKIPHYFNRVNGLICLLSVFLLLLSATAFSQISPDYKGGFKIKFDKEGKKYLRLVSWVQAQAIYNQDAAKNDANTNFNLRRARVLLYAQINKKFLILSHFGLNNLNANSTSPTGNGSGSQVFLHDMWAQYNITKNHSIGAGLHYFNGISRLNNQSTLNMLTLDNNRQSWATLGLSDQFVRHVGIFLKGKFKRLQYRLAINNAIVNGLDDRTPSSVSGAVYGGARLLGTKKAGKVFSGYFDYNFLDQESNFLPFKVGTYLGQKKVFNLGIGFFAHPDGSVIMDSKGQMQGQNVSIFAVDAFYDAPIGNRGAALTAYATYQNNEYGKNYLFNAYGTGNMVYSHLGYLFSAGKSKTRYQPYLSLGHNTYQASSDSRTVFGIGANAYLSGYNSKLTLEYKHQKFGIVKQRTLTLQAMIYL